MDTTYGFFVRQYTLTQCVSSSLYSDQIVHHQAVQVKSKDCRNYVQPEFHYRSDCHASLSGPNILTIRCVLDNLISSGNEIKLAR